MYSKIISVILLLSIFCWAAANGQAATEKCAEIEEYCQNHWDCCSGSCLSFSYKCVRSNRPVQTNPIGGSPPQSSQAGGVDLGNRFGANNTCATAGQYCQSHGDCCSQSCLTFSYKCIGDVIAAQPQYPLFIQSGGFQQAGNVDLGNRFGQGDVLLVQQSPVFGDQQPAIVNSLDDLISSLNFNQGNSIPSVPQTQNRFGESTGASASNNKCLAIGNRCANGPDCCSLNCAYNVCMAGYNITNGAEHSNQPCLELGEKCFRHDECCTGRCHGFLHQCVT